MSMRRKVLQDFANVFCQRFVDLPSGHDLATFVHLGSGAYELDILNDKSMRNGAIISPLKTSQLYRDWLDVQMAKHRVPAELLSAAMTIDVEVSRLRVSSSFGHTAAAAYFKMDCRSEIRTDEKVYVGRMSGEQDWGFDWYYEQLYGDPMALLRRQAST